MMSYPDSDISELLDKADTEELYKDVYQMVNYVNENGNFGHDLHVTVTEAFQPLEAENTMDLKQEHLFNDTQQSGSLVQLQHNPILPRVFSIPVSVCNEDYAGPYNFDVSIIPNGSKNPWVYSSKLNKVFIDMGAHFPVDFRVGTRPEGNLYIRVLPSFSALQHSQELVYRCVQHEQPQYNKDTPIDIRQHIIRVPSNPDANYLGDRYLNQRLSIVFPLSFPQTGTDAVREMFVFVCKNSCSTGMNRKSVEIIFTLETSNGEILGRRVLRVRICSCPKRDKEKEEKDSSGDDGVPRGKKRKLDKNASTAADDKNISTLTIDLAGKHNMQQALKYCQDLMAGEIMRNPQNNQSYYACYKKIQDQLSQL